MREPWCGRAGLLPSDPEPLRRAPSRAGAAFPGESAPGIPNLVEHREERNSPAGRLLVARTVPPPVVVIDGEPRIWGSIPVAMTLELVGDLLRGEPAGEGT